MSYQNYFDGIENIKDYVDSQIRQFTIMPTPSAANFGKIYQYVGETSSDDSLIKGYFYECVRVAENTYAWELRGLPTTYAHKEGSLPVSGWVPTEGFYVYTISDNNVKVNSLVRMYLESTAEIRTYSKTDGYIAVKADAAPEEPIAYTYEVIDTDTEGLFEIINATSGGIIITNDYTELPHNNIDIGSLAYVVNTFNTNLKGYYRFVGGTQPNDWFYEPYNKVSLIEGNDKFLDGTGTYVTVIKTDGTNQMDTGWTPVENQDVTTKVYVDTADTALQNNINAEENRAEGIETELRNDLNTETTERINDVDTEEARALAAEAVLTTNLATEASTARTNENTLDTRITTEVTNLKGDVASEYDTLGKLEDKIQEEATARIADVDAEESRAEGIENILRTDLTEETHLRENNDGRIEGLLNDEASTARANEGTLQDNIDSEEGARIAADTTLQNNINTEEAARIAADTTLQNNITAEETRATGAENILQAAVEAEEIRAEGAEDVLTTDLSNEVIRATAAESTLNTSLSNEVNRATVAENTLTTNLSNEVNRATGAESDLQNNIDTEEAARIAADTNLQNTLQANINAEAAARGTADTALQSNIESAVSTLKGSVTSDYDTLGKLEVAITTEASTARTNEGTLTANLSTEASTRESADNILTAAINTEKGRAEGIEGELRTDLTTETSNRTAADTAIHGLINQSVITDISLTTNEDAVNIVKSSRNLDSEATDSNNILIPLANTTTAGMMSHNDILAIEDLQERVAQLQGQTVRLFYDVTAPGHQSDPDAQQISDFVTGLGYTDPVGIAVIISDTFHIWHYYANATPNWKDDGVDTVTDFTNNTPGIIKGVQEDGKIYAETNGIGSVYGWDSLVTRVTNAESAITTEASTARTAETTLTTDLATEVTNRTNADATKVDKITLTTGKAAYTVDGSTQGSVLINDEATAGTIIVRDASGRAKVVAPNVDTDIANKKYVDDINTSLSEDVAAEETARIAADNLLQGNIGAEASARETADTNLGTRIGTEETSRASEITRVEGLITTEASSRANADAALGTRITNETTARTDADTVLGTRIGAEESARATGDNTLQTTIEAEETRAETAEGTLQDNIDAEQTRATGVENTLSTNLSGEVTRAVAAEGVLTTNLGNEINRAITAEGTLQNNIDAEEAARIAADNTLQDNIDAGTIVKSIVANITINASDWVASGADVDLWKGTAILQVNENTTLYRANYSTFLDSTRFPLNSFRLILDNSGAVTYTPVSETINGNVSRTLYFISSTPSESLYIRMDSAGLRVYNNTTNILTLMELSTTVGAAVYEYFYNNDSIKTNQKLIITMTDVDEVNAREFILWDFAEQSAGKLTFRCGLLPNESLHMTLEGIETDETFTQANVYGIEVVDFNELAPHVQDIINAKAEDADVVKTVDQTLSNEQKIAAKTNLDLDEVDNTSDLDKPISTAVQEALDELAAPLFVDITFNEENLVLTRTQIESARDSFLQGSNVILRGTTDTTFNLLVTLVTSDATCITITTSLETGDNVTSVTWTLNAGETEAVGALRELLSQSDIEDSTGSLTAAVMSQKATTDALNLKAPLADPEFTGTPKINNVNVATVDDIPTAVSELTNDSHFLSPDNVIAGDGIEVTRNTDSVTISLASNAPVTSVSLMRGTTPGTVALVVNGSLKADVEVNGLVEFMTIERI